MGSRGRTTTDHEDIRRWAEARGGRPMAIRGAGEDDAEAIRLVFPDAPPPDAADLEPISWDEWFRRFDEHDLALLMEELTSDGRQSRFNKLVRSTLVGR